ncbi:TetR/AcrR family transcriptional regulator [Phaeodactylibacter sp.]|jgi:AcrR family transcriptional regulator|uniref:TetR/AcrR family transcriptional regulator n=1 Tax=Phaeodactylibacter sp. TaxID=1940289 RepID=UPI0025DA4808|nr:TetR/AcrR family transcriptional regulator [Phaeodactylibacter sp.]MCI4647253.1 TetR family transcriptional regulator [Phaeodactylibacter sp.]MCI5089607.1 TetR family transcriptional regulator [Phaeodactylibacter sp.]
MKLKTKILNKAIELFNEQGISSTSPNQIAAALGISTGNLTYHYKTKASLVKEVYEQMDTDSQDFIKLEGYMTLHDFRKIIGSFQQFMHKHSFFFQDLFFILHNFPEVGKLYEGSNLRRLKHGRALFEHYIETGRMIPESGGINYDYLIHNVWMVCAFWNLQSKIFTPGTLFGKPMDIVDMTWHMILPYLTEKGKEEYDQINGFLQNNSTS